MAEKDTQEQEHDVRPGDTYESRDPREDDPRRRVRVVEVVGDQAVVENLSTGRHSRVAVGRLVEPYWKRGF